MKSDKRESRYLPVVIAFLATLLVFPAVAQEPSTDVSDAELFLRGRLAAEGERLDEALQIFDDLVRRNEDDPVLHFERARVLGSLRRIGLAEQALRKSIELDPAFYDARKLLGRMLLDRSGGDRARVEEALEHLTLAYQLQPNDLATGLTISQVFLGLGKLDEAKKVVEGLLEATPDHRSVNYQYAQILLRMNEQEEAAKYLENVILQEPYYRPAITQLLEIYEQTGRWSEAADLLRALTIQEPDNVELQRQYAYLLLRARRFEESRTALQSVLSGAPEDTAASFMMAETLSELGENEEAERWYRQTLEVRPDDPELLISFGLNQLALGDLDTAAAQFERLLALEGLASRARILAATQLAAIDHQRGDYESALARARGLLETEGVVNMQAVNITLDVLRRNEKYDDALKILDRMTANRDDAPILNARRIEFLTLAGEEKKAWNLARLQARKSLEGGLTAAQIYGQLDRYEDSLRVLGEIDEKFREEIDYLFQLGASYERTGKYAESESVFQKVLEKEPAHAATMNYLGYMWADRGVRLDEAEKLISEAVEQFPRNGAYVDSLGWVYYKLGRFDLAEKHLMDAADLVPDDPTIQEHLGDLFARTGDLERALDRYKFALELEPDDEAALRRKMRDLEEKIAARLAQ